MFVRHIYIYIEYSCYIIRNDCIVKLTAIFQFKKKQSDNSYSLLQLQLLITMLQFLIISIHYDSFK
jgi:hypothetical protein